MVNSMNKLHELIEKEEIENIKVLIENGVDINKRDDWGDTPLHLAINLELIEIIELLINKGADVNKVDYYGKTPIRWLSSHNKNIVKMLLEYGTDPNIKDNDGRTVLDDAYEENFIDAIELLISFGAKSIIKSSDYE